MGNASKKIAIKSVCPKRFDTRPRSGPTECRISNSEGFREQVANASALDAARYETLSERARA